MDSEQGCSNYVGGTKEVASRTTNVPMGSLDLWATTLVTEGALSTHGTIVIHVLRAGLVTRMSGFKLGRGLWIVAKVLTHVTKVVHLLQAGLATRACVFRPCMVAEEQRLRRLLQGLRFMSLLRWIW